MHFSLKTCLLTISQNQLISWNLHHLTIHLIINLKVFNIIVHNYNNNTNRNKLEMDQLRLQLQFIIFPYAIISYNSIRKTQGFNPDELTLGQTSNRSPEIISY